MAAYLVTPPDTRFGKLTGIIVDSDSAPNALIAAEAIDARLKRYKTTPSPQVDVQTDEAGVVTRAAIPDGEQVTNDVAAVPSAWSAVLLSNALATGAIRIFGQIALAGAPEVGA